MPEWTFDPAHDEEVCAVIGCGNAATMLDGEEYICTGHDPEPPTLHPCQRRPHYGEPCECEARLALVVTHTRTSTGGFGPDYCAECSEAISEWVQWPCDATRQ